MRLADVLRVARKVPLWDGLFRLRERVGDRVAVVQFKPAVQTLEDRVVPVRPLPLPTIYAGAGAGAGMAPIVRAFDVDTGALNFERQVYESAFTGGVRVASADIDKDALPDGVVGPGPGGGPHIRVLDWETGEPLPGPIGDFYAYEASFTGGVNLAVGDVDGDGYPDVIVAAGPGGGPRVRVFSGEDASVLADFYAYDPDFRGGITVASADFTGDYRAEIVVGAGPEGGPHVKVYDLATGEPVVMPGAAGNFFAYESDYRGGVWVATGDVDGDKSPDLVTGPGSDHSPQVRAWRGTDGVVLADFAAFDPDMTAGVRVATIYVNDDAKDDIVAGTGPGVEARVRIFGDTSGILVTGPAADFLPFGAGELGGVFIGAENDPLVPQVNFPYSLTGTVDGAPFRAVGSVQTKEVPAVNTPTGTLDFYAKNYVSSEVVKLGSGTLAAGTTGTASVEILVDHDWLADMGIAVDYAFYTLYSGDGVFQAGGSTLGGISMGMPDPFETPPACDAAGFAAVSAPGAGGGAMPAQGDGGVRLADGAVSVSRTDLGSDAGLGWGHAWAWTNAGGYADGSGGNGTGSPQLPRLSKVNNLDGLALVGGGTTAHFFDSDTGSQTGYRARYFPEGMGSFGPNSGATEYTLVDGAGNELTFYGFAGSVPAGRAGRLISFEDPTGNTVSVTSWDSAGRPAEVQRTPAGGGIVESWVYAYSSSGSGGVLTSVTERRSATGGSPWGPVRSVEYEYSGSSTLKKAVTKDAAGTAVDTSYYRWWPVPFYPMPGVPTKPTLKAEFGPAAYARLTAALGTNVDALTDAQVLPYADRYYEYAVIDARTRVTKAIMAGDGCSSCTGGQGTYMYSYTTRSPMPSITGPNVWVTSAVETRPDGATLTAYMNGAGESVLEVRRDPVTSAERVSAYRYDDKGRLLTVIDPSALTGYNTSNNDPLSPDATTGNLGGVADAAGHLSATEYATSTTATSTTAGDIKGMPKRVVERRGELGTALPQAEYSYLLVNGVPVQATSTVFRNDNGTGGQTTSTAFTWQGSSSRPATVTTTLPTVTTAQNGPNSATSATTSFDTFGRPIWMKDAAGFLSYMAYDPATGAVVKQIADVNTTQTSTFAGLPSGWTTPSGGGLHPTTTYEVDVLGRTTKTTRPHGRIDYAVYNEAAQEVRTYAAWDATLGGPTGPTHVSRVDRGRGYTESLTMSATPAVSGGRPTGTESISGVLTLSRSYVNAVGQTVHTDAYFDLTGVTYSQNANLGTENANYYRTRSAYTHGGPQSRVQTPAGTITRTWYDWQQRAESEWVGTNDTPTSGTWSPTNAAGMVKVRDYEYDADGNATKVTDYPGAGAAARVTQTWYDWRDRPVAVKAGVETSEATDVNRPISYTDYDNLGNVTKSRTYDGDGVTPTDANSDGVPDAPTASLLRTQSGATYDELGREFLAEMYSVDPSSGSLGSTLRSDSWYDIRGQVVKSAEPGGLVRKTTYDGVGRAVASYTTDGGGDTGYADADDAAGDIVLEQAESTFDAAGNVLASTSRQRFHDATGTGVLGSPSSGTGARVSYAGYYYDLADRPTATVDVGTNAASAWTRPGSVPSRSDTVLVTSQTYDSAGRVYEVTDPRGLVARTTYDNSGRTAKTVENYTDGTVSDTDDKTTEYAYGPAGMTGLTAKLTGGGVQTTAWVHGVTTGGGSAIDSNDTVAATRWPDPSTGAASSGQQDTVTVNALGQTLTSADRNGSVHSFAYDVLGRPTADAVTTLGSGVDGSVRRIGTEYDGQGNPYRVTSYDAATSGSVVNQVQRAYNGLGQLTAEYQAHAGAVNTSTTPKVQYAYSEMPSGANHSRPASMTYPGGFVLNYAYGTSAALNDRVSRLEAINDGTATVEGYAYLGLGGVVKRTHPEASAELTYIKLTGESNGDAGDPYTGLDRFGRVVDQRWVDGSGTALDREKYGYDRNGNRLYADNLLDNNFDELYHANGASAGYDGLNQLAAFRRGALSDADSDGRPDTVVTATRTQVWTPDAVGNFSDVTTDGVSQTRTHNKQNEITAISGATTPTYDAAGNMTGDEAGKQFVYDAWNRLTVVKTTGGSTLEVLTNDALGRRVRQTVGSTTTDLFFSTRWQALEEKVGSATTQRFVWSPEYVDALILRDRDSDANGSLEERIFTIQDANWNVVALVDSAPTLVERIVYDTFGATTVLTSGFGSRTTSSFDWMVGFQGLVFDTHSKFSNARNRWYSPVLYRWATMDPILYNAGDINLYLFVKNAPTYLIDPLGQKPSQLTVKEALPRPVYGFNGAFLWPVTFQLNEKTVCGGIVVQHVIRTTKTWDNNGSSQGAIAAVVDYYEAWRVHPNKDGPDPVAPTETQMKLIKDQFIAPKAGTMADDWYIGFRFPFINGSIVFKGEVFYFDNMDISDLPGPWDSKHTDKKPAGGLPSIETAGNMKFITQLFFRAAFRGVVLGPVPHDLSVKWRIGEVKNQTQEVYRTPNGT